MNHTTTGIENLSPTTLQMKIGDTNVSVEWEDNASIEALAELVKRRIPRHSDVHVWRL